MSNLKTRYDKWLLIIFFTLLGIGLIMVTSASVAISEKMNLPTFYFAYHQCLYIAIGLSVFFTTSHMPIKYFKTYSIIFLLVILILLSILLLPGITHPINGSIRWLFFGPISIQPSEIIKLSIIIYISNYMVSNSNQMHTQLIGLLIPILILTIITLLLLLEPDFGAAIIITLITLGMLFLGGLQFKRFLALLLIIMIGITMLSMSSSYRILRFLSFANPWYDQYNAGYQLAQSLIAFGNGAWFGTGLGGSVQKLFYLPESHTDFIFAVLAEEFGLFGVFLVILLYIIFIHKTMKIGRRARLQSQLFNSYIAYGIALWIGLQSVINVGVNIGIFPTKGITLPFMSSGGSSIIIMCMAAAILFRIDFESRFYRNVHKVFFNKI